MDEYLSTRQVIEILKVDRITIYRMLQDGRLKGIKIGQQWRFSRGEVDRLLGAEPAAPKNPPPDSRAGFPTHCVQTVQDLFSDISQISALMVDPDGNPLTEITHPCSFCRLVLQSPEGQKACLASWGSFVQRSNAGINQHTCHAGLEYVSTPVIDGENTIGVFLSGQFHKDSPEGSADAEQLHRLSSAYEIQLKDLQKAARQIPFMTQDQRARIEDWSASAARAVQSILHERTGYLSRLQQIANLSQIS